MIPELLCAACISLVANQQMMGVTKCIVDKSKAEVVDFMSDVDNSGVLLSMECRKPNQKYSTQWEFKNGFIRSDSKW